MELFVVAGMKASQFDLAVTISNVEVFISS